jgi:hypothetical protein
MDMPFIEEDWIPLHENGVEDYNTYRSTLLGFVESRGLDFIDMTTFGWTKDEFYDFLHVNSAGIELINAMLAEQLVAQT